VISVSSPGGGYLKEAPTKRRIGGGRIHKTAESDEDQRIAIEIREIAGRFKGLVNLRSGIDIPDGLQGKIDVPRYIQGRLQGARGLAIYNIMSRIRSSRAALVEHLLGTEEASKRYGVKGKIKQEDTGNVLGRLEDSAGEIKNSSIMNNLPDWLRDSEKHRDAVKAEMKLYQSILSLVGKMSDRREKEKSLQLSSLMKSHPLILAFDSCLITLEIIKGYIVSKNDCEVVVATGSHPRNRKKVNELFALGSEANGVIALCSDAMSEGLNLQQASTVLLLDMPSVIRIAEQRVGRVDRMDSPHKEIEVWWPVDSDAFSIKTDRKFFRRHKEVKDILGSNIELPEDLVPEEMVDGPSTVEDMVKKLEDIEKKGEAWDGIYDAFQPVRELVDSEKGIVPKEVYNHLKHSKARVLSSISIVKANSAWAFFAIAGVDRGAPKWIYLNSLTSKPLVHLEEVAKTLRRLLTGDIENRKMDQAASSLIDKFLKQILSCEKDLLPRKKQRALEEMYIVINYYRKKATDQKKWEDFKFYDKLLKMVDVSAYELERPDLNSIAEAWLDLTRDVWYQKLIKRRRFKPLRLKDIRQDLRQNPFSVEQLQQAFASIPYAQPLHSRVVSAIVGVPTAGS